MKTKMMLLLALSISMIGFAQKDEIKAAAKAMKTGDAATAKSALEGAAGTIDGADPKLQAQYYALLGDASKQLSDYEGAINAYNKVVSVEEASGKPKYASDAKVKLGQITGELVNAAVEDSNNKKYVEGATKLYQAYKLSPRDTIYLYYAASTAVQGGADNYDQAIEYYKELKDLNYDGSEIKYSAVDVATGETVNLDAQSYELYKKTNSYKDFKEEKTPSKRAEIVKNIALIYQEQGKNDEALAAYDDAMVSNSDDVNLILNMSNLLYGMGEKERSKELMAKASEMAPDNPTILYNIGAINGEQGNTEAASEAYKKALEVDPAYVDARVNLAVLFVEKGNKLIDEMNNLGTSRADSQRYDELKSEKDEFMRKGAAILEEGLKATPENPQILDRLKGIYGALGDTENFMRIKKMMGE